MARLLICLLACAGGLTRGGLARDERAFGILDLLLPEPDEKPVFSFEPGFHYAPNYPGVDPQLLFPPQYFPPQFLPPQYFPPQYFPPQYFPAPLVPSNPLQALLDKLSLASAPVPTPEKGPVGPLGPLLGPPLGPPLGKPLGPPLGKTFGPFSGAFEPWFGPDGALFPFLDRFAQETMESQTGGRYTAYLKKLVRDWMEARAEAIRNRFGNDVGSERFLVPVASGRNWWYSTANRIVDVLREAGRSSCKTMSGEGEGEGRCTTVLGCHLQGGTPDGFCPTGLGVCCRGGLASPTKAATASTVKDSEKAASPEETKAASSEETKTASSEETKAASPEKTKATAEPTTPKPTTPKPTTPKDQS